jgi:hypothetical protein
VLIRGSRVVNSIDQTYADDMVFKGNLEGKGEVLKIQNTTDYDLVIKFCLVEAPEDVVTITVGDKPFVPNTFVRWAKGDFLVVKAKKDLTGQVGNYYIEAVPF